MESVGNGKVQKAICGFTILGNPDVDITAVMLNTKLEMKVLRYYAVENGGFKNISEENFASIFRSPSNIGVRPPPCWYCSQC